MAFLGKIRKEVLVVPVEAFVMKVAFGVVFTDFVKVVHVELSNVEGVPVGRRKSSCCA
jgi:hypothetical protein